MCVKRLDFTVKAKHAPRMGLPEQPVTLTPEQVEALQKRFSEARHNINNHLALIVAASELLARKPEAADRVSKALKEPPDKIVEELRGFSSSLEKALQIVTE